MTNKALNTKSNSARGIHSNSVQNLRRDGRPSAEKIYEEPKRRRNLLVTETGWLLATAKIKRLGYGSVPKFLEKWGREE